MKLDLRNVPFSPRRSPVHYGWVVLACGIGGMLASVPGQTIGVSVFTEPLMKAMGLSRLSLSMAYLVGTLASASILTFAGLLYDRWGSRVLGPLAAVGLGATLLLFSRADGLTARLAGWLGFEAVPAPLAFGVTCVGFFLLRFLGQGVLTMSARNMVMKWFDTRRGLANGLSSVFVAFGFSSAPLGLAALVSWWGWRGTWVVLGLVVGGAFALLAAVLYRDNPEQLGLEPDAGLPRKRGGPGQHPERAWTLRQAVRTRAFWLFNLGLSLNSLYITALTFHVVSIFGSGGLTQAQAIGIFLPGSAIAVAFSLVGGWVSDYIRLKWLLMVLVGGVAVSSAGLVVLGPGWPVWLIIAGNGLGGGMFGVVAAVTWPRFFGRRHLGAISGFNMTWLVLASAIGPALFGASLDWAGSYRPAGWLCLGVALALLAGATRADDPSAGEGDSVADPFPVVPAAGDEPAA